MNLNGQYSLPDSVYRAHCHFPRFCHLKVYLLSWNRWSQLDGIAPTLSSAQGTQKRSRGPPQYRLQRFTCRTCNPTDEHVPRFTAITGQTAHLYQRSDTIYTWSPPEMQRFNPRGMTGMGKGHCLIFRLSGKGERFPVIVTASILQPPDM